MLKPTRQRGLTLVELMVSLAIGSLLLLGLTTFYVNSLKSNAEVLNAMRLNQTLRASMLLISRDLRRAGYWAGTAATGNPFKSMTTSTSGCVLYSYDRTGSGATTVPEAAKYGYLLKDGVLMMRSGGSVHSCTPGSNNSWEALTDSGLMTITSLAFSPNAASATSLTITLAARLTSASAVTLTLTETIKLENGPITIN